MNSNDPSGDSDEVSSTNESRLLSLPSPVIDVIVSKCNVKSLLTLREVCQTTKYWVDNIPELNAEELMSKVQIRMGIDLEIIQRFNESSPPLPITSLSLDTSKMEVATSPEETTAMWNKYFEYWTPRLLSLEIQNDQGELFFENKDHKQIKTTIKRFLNDCPRLKKLVCLKGFDFDLGISPFPQSLLSITDLIIDGDNFLELHQEYSSAQNTGLMEYYDYDDYNDEYEDNESDGVSQFFTELGKNRSLKTLAVKITRSTDMVAFRKFIDAHKDNTALQISIKWGKYFPSRVEQGQVPHDVLLFVFLELVKRAVASESQIVFHLKFNSPFSSNPVSFLDVLSIAKQQLSPVEYFKFTNEQIQSLSEDRPLNYNFMTYLGLFEGLKDLRLVRMAPQILANFQFPPNLTSLECGSGFPNLGNLPMTITNLTLCNVRCGLNELERSWALLSNHCVNLERLSMFYSCNEKSVVTSSTGNGGYGDHRPTVHFRKLESVCLEVYIESGDEQQAITIARELILNRLKLDQIPLRHLFLSTHRLSVPGIEDNELENPGVSFIKPRVISESTFGPYIRPAVKGQLEHNYLHLLDKSLLSRFCNGPIASTLMFLDCAHKSVSKDGVPLRKRLESICKTNIKKRIVQEGRGPWMYKYPKKDELFWVG